MNHSRRDALKTVGGVGLLSVLTSMGLLRSGDAWAQEWLEAAFMAHGFADTLTALGVSAPVASENVVITAPDRAESGASVQITVESKLPGTEQIAYLVESNPRTLNAIFDIPTGTLPMILTRVKLAGTSNFMALVKAQGKYYMAQKKIEAPAGAC